MRIDMPDGGRLQLESLVLDINGTLTADGELLPEVRARLAALGDGIRVRLVTRDTLGRGGAIAEELGVEIDRVTDEEKMTVIDDPATAVMIGNGISDVEALRRCAVGIAVIGPEGCAAEAFRAADVVVADINHALDLLLTPSRLVSTLRR